MSSAEVNEVAIQISVSLDEFSGLNWSSENTRTLYLSVPDGTSPTVANPIPDQAATVGTAFSYQFPLNTFADAQGDALTYTATKPDDAMLPTWLGFTATTRTFSGTAQAADVETLAVKVTASDGTASVSDEFDIGVSAAGDTSAPTLSSADGSHTRRCNRPRVQRGVRRSLTNEVEANFSSPTLSLGKSDRDRGLRNAAVRHADQAPRTDPDPGRMALTRLSPTITQGQAVVVTYTDPTAGDDAVAIEDAAGNETATFTTGVNSVPDVVNNSDRRLGHHRALAEQRDRALGGKFNRPRVQRGIHRP